MGQRLWRLSVEVAKEQDVASTAVARVQLVTQGWDRLLVVRHVSSVAGWACVACAAEKEKNR